MIRVVTCLFVEHDLRLVLVAAVICILASFTAVRLILQARASAGTARIGWIATAGVATSIGIWATHFIAILAYQPGVAVGFSISLTGLSLLAAMIITTAGLALATYDWSWQGSVAGGAILGAGVACMHYLGMSALEVPGHFEWSMDLIVASVVIGMGLGATALSVAVKGGMRGTAGGAALLTLAIVSHHFTGMGAITVVHDASKAISESLLSTPVLAALVAIAALAVLGLSLATSLANYFFGQQSKIFSTILENLNSGVCLFDHSGKIIAVNQRFASLHDLPSDLMSRGWALRDLIEHRKRSGHPIDDVTAYCKTVIDDVRAGKTTSWHSKNAHGRSLYITNRPIATGGWVANHEDITELQAAEQQKHEVSDLRTRRADVDAAIAAFRANIEAVLASFGAGAGTMRSTVKTLTDTSEETARRTFGARSASSTAANNVSAAASAANQMFVSIAEINRSLNETNGLINSAAADADATNEKISGMAQSAGDIGGVVKLIQSIARQIHLLALNATIEAARAGSAGAGFAVVAREVKSLADQTAVAAQDISGQIEAVQSSTLSAVEAIRRSMAHLHEINQKTVTVAAALGQQSQAADEISRNVENAARLSGSVAEALEHVGSAVATTGQSAQTVMTVSADVQDAADSLRQTVDVFLSKVAA